MESIFKKQTIRMLLAVVVSAVTAAPAAYATWSDAQLGSSRGNLDDFRGDFGGGHRHQPRQPRQSQYDDVFGPGAPEPRLPRHAIRQDLDDQSNAPIEGKDCVLNMHYEQKFEGQPEGTPGTRRLIIRHATSRNVRFVRQMDYNNLDLSRLTGAERTLYKEQEVPAHIDYVCPFNKSIYRPHLVVRQVEVECQHGKAYARKLFDLTGSRPMEEYSCSENKGKPTPANVRR